MWLSMVVLFIPSTGSTIPLARANIDNVPGTRPAIQFTDQVETHTVVVGRDSFEFSRSHDAPPAAWSIFLPERALSTAHSHLSARIQT